MPEKIKPGDQFLDALFANRPKTNEPVSVPDAIKMAEEKPPFVRKTLPTGKQELSELSKKMVEWYPENAVFYHPELKQNVIKQSDSLVVISDGDLDEDAWLKGGMQGTAPLNAEARAKRLAESRERPFDMAFVQPSTVESSDSPPTREIVVSEKGSGKE